MTILGIETATSVCGAAVVRDGVVLHEAWLDMKSAHAERLLGQIDDALRGSGVAVGFLDAVAVSIGPGSFTGLRIGLSVAKGLVYAAGVSLVGVPTLVALARHAVSVDPPGENEWVLAALDARRDEVYCQLFGTQRASYAPVRDAEDRTVVSLREELAGLRVLVAGDGAGKVIGSGDGRLRGGRAAAAGGSLCSAGAVALLGEEMFRTGTRDDVATLEPRYIKEFFLKAR